MLLVLLARLGVEATPLLVDVNAWRILTADAWCVGSPHWTTPTRYGRADDPA